MDECKCGNDLQGPDEVASGMCDICALWIDCDYEVMDDGYEFDHVDEVDDWDLM